MADDRRRRFLQIERPRGPGAPDPAPPGTAVEGRFGAPDRQARPAEPAPPAAPAAPAVPVAPGHVERFRPAAQVPLEVADRGDGSQPFVRCCGCETDNTLYAVRCTTCGAELHTDAQRAFNERLWQERRAIAGAEAAAAAERRAGLEAAAEEAARARRAMGEALARQVGDAERRRLEGGGLGEPPWGPDAGSGRGTGWGDSRGAGWTGDGLLGGQPVALRLLAAIPDPRWRVAAGVAAIAVPALLYLVAPGAGLVVGLVVLGLFMPGGWRWRRRWW
jgi:hypothetical protein